MKDIENIISSFVESQFPEFYKSEGSRFVDFLKQYYRWLESENQAVNASRSLFNIRDIDKTKDEFLVYFKEKYFRSLPFNLQSNTRLLTKFATDLYNVKGTERGIELVLRGIFNEESTIRYPSEQIFRLSNGEWVRPVYIELSTSERTKDFVNKEIQGFNSGAKAFFEVLVRRRINSKVIDVGYLSNVRGDFQTGEIITLSSNTVVENAPVVIGSLTELDIINGGANFVVGDVFNIVSSNGKQGKARVTEVEDRAGTVTFLFENSLKNGGWGYSINTEPTISSKVLILQNQFNSNDQITTFSRFEDVQQVLANVSYSSASPNNAAFVAGSILENYNANGTVNASAIIVSAGVTNSSAGYLVISPQTGNLVAIDTTFSIKGNTTTAVATAYVDRTVTSNVVGSNTTSYSITFNAATEVSSDSDSISFLNHPFVNNQLVLYRTPVGNTTIGGLSNNSLYYVLNTTNTSFQLSDTYAGTALNLTAKGSSENGHVLYTTTGFLGVSNISGVSFLATPYANIVGLTTNTTATIANVSSGTDADFTIGTITDTENVLLNPDFIANRNTANVPFDSIRLNGFNSNLSYYGTDVTFNPSVDVNATNDDIAISSANDYTANTPVLYIVDTGNTAVSPLVSNTVYYIDTANSTHVSLKATKTGSKIELTVGSNETGHHLIGPLLETTTGDQGNTVLFKGIGFLKHPTAQMDSVLLDCLRFVSVNIGSIASLTSINPGNDYNVDPFVVVVEPLTLGYHRRDYLMTVSNTVGSFIVGEQVEQAISEPTVILTVSGWNTSGSANGSSPLNYEVPEYVYQEYDGDIQAYGFVKEAGVSLGVGTVKLANVVGTFVTTSNNSTYVYSRTTASTANIESISNATDASRARALVKQGSNNFSLKLKRINLENTFVTGSPIVGRSSGAVANVVSIFEDESTEFIGVNANIVANAATSNGVVKSLEVFDSGFGYIDAETLTLTKEGSAFQVTAAAQIIKQGQGEGFFLSTKGFLDADKKIHDNEYYQEFSYDIETKIPFEQYFNVLKQLAHVAGTRAFGSVISLTVLETPLSVTSEISLEEAPGSYVHSYTGTFTDTVYTADYAGTYSKTYTKQYSSAFTAEFVSAAYTGLYNTNYSGSFTAVFTKIYTANYSAVYSTPFIGSYTRSFISSYVGATGYRGFISLYTGTYAREFVNLFNSNLQFTRQFTPNVPYTSNLPFSGQAISFAPFTALFNSFFSGRPVAYQNIFTPTYTSSYTPSFTGSFTALYQGGYTGVAVFTRQFVPLYTGAYNTTFNSFFTRGFINNYTHDYASSYTTGYLSAFTKRYSGRYTISFTNEYINAFTNVYTLNYTGSYQSQYSGESYTRIFSGAYQLTLYTGAFTQLYSGVFTTPYSVSYTNQYTKTFSGEFTSLFNQIYTRQFTSSFTRNYSKAYSAEYTQTRSYTDNFSLSAYSSDVYTKDFTTVFGTVYSGDYSGGFIGDTYTSDYSGFSSSFTADYSGSYTGVFNGFTNSFTGQFTRTSVRNYSINYTSSYSGNFTSGFSGQYSGLFTSGYSSLGNYTAIYTSIYTGAYSGFSPITQQFASVYTSDYTIVTYTSNYSSQFSGTYGNFTGSYSGQFSNQFTGSFTKLYTAAEYTGIEYTGIYGQ